MRLLLLGIIQRAVRDGDRDWLLSEGMAWLNILDYGITKDTMLKALARQKRGKR